MKPIIFFLVFFTFHFFLIGSLNLTAQNIYYLNQSGTFLKSEENASVKIEIVQQDENHFSIFTSDEVNGKWTKPEFVQKVKKISDSIFHVFDNQKMKGNFLIREIIEKNEAGYKVKQTTSDGTLIFSCDAIEIIPLRMNGKCIIYDNEQFPMAEEIYVNGKRISETLLFHPLNSLKRITKNAEFPGGQLEFRKKVASTVRYPVSAMQKGQGGKAYVKFLINEIGEVNEIKVATISSSILSTELARTMLNIKDLWSPAECNGEKIPVWYYASIKFNCPIAF